MIELVDQELTLALALALLDGRGRIGERVTDALELRQGGRHLHDGWPAPKAAARRAHPSAAAVKVVPNR
jgi:hypothetical protein